MPQDNEPDNGQRYNDMYEKEKFHFDQDWAKEKKHFDRKATEESYMKTDVNKGDGKMISPRRKWYESEECWRKRKRKERRLRAKQKSMTRKRWENSAPVRNLRESRGKNLIFVQLKFFYVFDYSTKDALVQFCDLSKVF